MRMIRLVCVGKLKAAWWRSAAAEYQQRIARFAPLEEHLVPDGAAALPAAKRMQAEGEKLLAALEPKDYVILLDERGKAHTSTAFADKLAAWMDDPGFRPCLVIGGAFGCSKEVKSAARETLSLGPMTLPHELARVVLLEQLYRALTIQRGMPYHHA